MTRYFLVFAMTVDENEEGPNVALVAMSGTPAEDDELRGLLDRFQSISDSLAHVSIGNRLASFDLWYAVEWYDLSDDTLEEYELCAENPLVEISADQKAGLFGHQESFRTEMDQLAIRKDGLHWHALLKHGGKVNTANLSRVQVTLFRPPPVPRFEVACRADWQVYDTKPSVDRVVTCFRPTDAGKAAAEQLAANLNRPFVPASWPNLVFNPWAEQRLTEMAEFLNTLVRENHPKAYAIWGEFLDRLDYLSDYGGAVSAEDTRRRFKITVGRGDGPLDFGVRWDMLVTTSLNDYRSFQVGALVWHGGPGPASSVRIDGDSFFDIHT